MTTYYENKDITRRLPGILKKFGIEMPEGIDQQKLESEMWGGDDPRKNYTSYEDFTRKGGHSDSPENQSRARELLDVSVHGLFNSICDVEKLLQSADRETIKSLSLLDYDSCSDLVRGNADVETCLRANDIIGWADSDNVMALHRDKAVPVTKIPCSSAVLALEAAVAWLSAKRPMLTLASCERVSVELEEYVGQLEDPDDEDYLEYVVAWYKDGGWYASVLEDLDDFKRESHDGRYGAAFSNDKRWAWSRMLERDFEVDLTEYEYEIYQWFIVDDRFAAFLENEGETVGRLESHAGAWVWGRGCFGQCISMDSVFKRYCVHRNVFVLPETSEQK